MRVSYYRNLNKSEKYITNKRKVKSYFSNDEAVTIVFGLRRVFDFGGRGQKMPSFEGVVVASAYCNRDKTITISFYPISQNVYEEIAYEEFNNKVLPDIKKWVGEQVSKPDTAILGIEELIIEWNGKTHLFHNVKFL